MTALEGLGVLELADEKLAFAGKLLGDMGADVILIEPPGGDPSRNHAPYIDNKPGENRSLHFMHYNTSKRSVVLDIGQDQASFRKLVASADILIESEPTTRLKALSLDYDDLESVSPGLIHIAMTP